MDIFSGPAWASKSARFKGLFFIFYFMGMSGYLRDLFVQNCSYMGNVIILGKFDAMSRFNPKFIIQVYHLYH